MIKKFNPHIFQYEQYLLAETMLKGKPLNHERKFTDKRHTCIYPYLTHFLFNHPQSQHNAEWFTWFLNRYPGLLSKCGGRSYICYLFRGINDA